MITADKLAVTSMQFAQFKEKFNDGGYPGKRFGQAFTLVFLSELIDNDDEQTLKLYNETDTPRALKLAEAYVI